MSIYGTSGQGTYSVSFPNLDTMIAAFPDNTANLIKAADIRDMALTLWDRTSGAPSASSILYQNINSTFITVGGIVKGTNFSTPTSIESILNQMLYPYIAPYVDFNLSYSSGAYSNSVVVEYGASSSIFNFKNIITQGSIDISTYASVYFSGTSIVYKGIPATKYFIIPPVSTTQSVSNQLYIPPNIDTTITMCVNDGYGTYSNSASISWQNKIYWGSLFTFSSITSSNILGLTGANSGTGNILSNTRIQTRNGINGNGSYLIFAWPETFGYPTFVINGLISSAFSSQSTVFTNNYGYTSSYVVWYSNTKQNSAISQFQIN